MERAHANTSSARRAGLRAVPPSQAEDAAIGTLWVTSGFVSKHSSSRDYNENNQGVGFEYTFNPNWQLAAGVYDNSLRQTSRYAQAVRSSDATLWRSGDWKARLGVAVGLVDGYPDMRHGGVFPTLLPVASLEWNRVGVNLTYIPSIAGNVSGAVALQLKLQLY
jgi:hypothetical protein